MTDTNKYDPRKDVADQLAEAVGEINNTAVDRRPALNRIMAMDEAGAFVNWIEYDEDDPSTHPPLHEKVLALVVWSKAGTYWGVGDRETDRTADFYQPMYGMVMLKRDLEDGPDDEEGDELILALDHGDQNYDNGDEDWIGMPRWWTRIGMPQQLDLDARKETP